MVGARRIRSEKLREDRCRKGCSRSLEGKRVEGDRDDVEYMWEQVKREMVESAREVRGSRIVGSKNPKTVLYNDEVKAAVRRKEAAWKGVLATSDKKAKKKKKCMEAYGEEKR